MQYTSRRPLQEVLRGRLREPAATHVRYGYRRLTVPLRREGWSTGFTTTRTLECAAWREKRTTGGRGMRMAPAIGPNECWSADFVSDKLTDGCSCRILTVIDQFTREFVALEADRSLHGRHVVLALTRAIVERGRAPRSITLDNGSEFTGRALEAWAIQHGVELRFIRPGRPVENGYIENFNGRLRDERLNVEWFGSLHQARERLAQRRDYYNL